MDVVGSGVLVVELEQLVVLVLVGVCGVLVVVVVDVVVVRASIGWLVVLGVVGRGSDVAWVVGLVVAFVV